MFRCCLCLLLACWAGGVAASTLVRVPITAEEKYKLDAFLRGRDIQQINDFASPELDSVGPIEHVIFRKALLLGGLDARFEDAVVPNSVRAREETALCEVTGGGTAHWHPYYAQLSREVYESSPVIAQGVYEKGLYTTREKAATLKIAGLDSLRKLTAVTSDTWVIDWATLQGLSLKALYSGANRTAQFRMVQGGRADFTLQDFSAAPDMEIEDQGVRLYPIPGVKIALSGTRHYFICRKAPEAAKVFAALQKGLQIMRQSGEIDRILSSSGFVSKGARGWLLLNHK